jgi:hypothetical protein
MYRKFSASEGDEGYGILYTAKSREESDILRGKMIV